MNKKSVDGNIMDSLLSDEESDMHFEPVPAMPEGLLEKTLKHCESAIELEIARMEDISSLRFKKRVEEFTGKPYNPTADSLVYRLGTWFYRTFK